MSRPETATRISPASALSRARRTSKMAIWSLILSIIWLGGLGSVAAIVLGTAARRRIAATGERGAGLAAAGIIGVITLLFAIAYWAFIAMRTGSHSGSLVGRCHAVPGVCPVLAIRSRWAPTV